MPCFSSGVLKFAKYSFSTVQVQLLQEPCSKTLEAGVQTSIFCISKEPWAPLLSSSYYRQWNGFLRFFPLPSQITEEIVLDLLASVCPVDGRQLVIAWLSKHFQLSATESYVLMSRVSAWIPEIFTHFEPYSSFNIASRYSIYSRVSFFGLDFHFVIYCI